VQMDLQLEPGIHRFQAFLTPAAGRLVRKEFDATKIARRSRGLGRATKRAWRFFQQPNSCLKSILRFA
jgi:hypothetical protein